VPVNDAALAATGVQVVRADVAHPDGGHDEVRLANALVALGK
jgi:hypothetical protein